MLHYYKKLGQIDKFESYDIESFHKFLQFVIASKVLDGAEDAPNEVDSDIGGRCKFYDT